MRIFSIGFFAAFFFLLINQARAHPWVAIPAEHVTAIAGGLLFLAIGSVLASAFFAQPVNHRG